MEVITMKTWEQLTEELKRKNETTKVILEEAEIMAKIVSSIITKREELGFSQRKLAHMCELPQSSIARIESCVVVPKLDTLIKIMIPLGLSLSVISA